MSTNRIFTVDKFLGINESEDGSTELKLGEASLIKNFTITDAGNLQTRPGAALFKRYASEQILNFWRGVIGTEWYVVIVKKNSNKECIIEVIVEDFFTPENYITMEEVKVDFNVSKPVKIAPDGDKLYVFGEPTTGLAMKSIVCIFKDVVGKMVHKTGVVYVPLTLTGCSPDGKGETLEPMNIVCSNMRLLYSADGTSKDYVLPSNVKEAYAVVDNDTLLDGSYSQTTHTFTFKTAPVKGVNNVEFRCTIEDAEINAAAQKFYNMRYSEAYNGSTDGRLFFYGDGTNVCYYTGVPAFGSGFYLPAGNEIAINATASEITAMCRDYSRLLVFTSDSAFSVTYEPTTLVDGTVIAGFTVKPVHKEIGCDVPGQVQMVSNYPRTICKNGIYDWKIASYSYRDERYAKLISLKVKKTLQRVDMRNAVCCDDSANRTYYVFLNDEKGTVIVHRYELDAWSIYEGEVFKDVLYANTDTKGMLFASANSIYQFDYNESRDVSLTEEKNNVDIEAVWESGYMSFGAPFKRKYSSTIWISVLPEVASNIGITVSTDSRDEYRQKETGINLFSWNSMDFSNFSFTMNNAPKIKRIKLKVKKFVYYKMIFNVSRSGARATVLGYDQQVRFSSYAK